MAWYGTVEYGTVGYGTYRTILYLTHTVPYPRYVPYVPWGWRGVRCGAVRYGALRYGTVRYGTESKDRMPKICKQ